MQEKLDEILKSIIGKSQNSSSANLSKPKQFAHKVIDAFDVMATANAKTSFTQSVWNSIKWYMKNKIIPNKSDDEVRADLKNIHDTIRPLFQTINTATEIQEARILNTIQEGAIIQKSKAQLFIESNPDFQEALGVIEEL